ncbi:MAG: aconitate hydratase [Desulfovibrionaceae bacterium]
MGRNITQKIIARHLVSGDMEPGSPIEIKIDQTLTQDATGTMAYLQFEAMGVDHVQTELSVSYVDHNTLQMGFRNADDHRYLQSVARKYGIVYSPPGTGICHQLHLENFAKPGTTLIGSDSHTPTAGGVGSLAMGAGGLSVALAMAGEAYALTMPKVVRVWLEGELRGWASAKDIILHLLGLLTVKGGVGKVFEYAGPGVKTLSVPERATITNMGAELGATTSIFPSDEQTHEFIEAMKRPRDFEELVADADATYDEEIRIVLDELEPMAAAPHMPDKVVPIRELAGLRVDQVCIGSCTNSSYQDLWTVARILDKEIVHQWTDLLISPGSKQVLKMLAKAEMIEPLIDSGARLLECACGPCIGQGASPASGSVSVRTFNRNFEGRSGTQDAQVYLTSPLVAARVAIDGAFTDPVEWPTPPLRMGLPNNVPTISYLFMFPTEDDRDAEIVRGPNIVALKPVPPLPDTMDATVALKVEDNITTDHILPGGEVMSLRSNIPAISEYVFTKVDPTFASRMKELDAGVIVGGENYGQGSSREHAALAPRYLGVTAVLVKSLARIHRANLINFGILPLFFADKGDYDTVAQGAAITIAVSAIVPSGESLATVKGVGDIRITNDLTERELAIIKAGGLLNFVRLSKKG